MSDQEMEEGLETVLDELNQTKGVEGAIIVSSVGEVLKHNLKSSGDLGLFGPMAQVIDSSSQRLLGSAGLGEMEKVLLESKKGKSLFLQLKKVHLIILIQKKANLGMIMRAAQRVSPQIIKITQDMEVVGAEPIVEEVAVEEPVQEAMESVEVPAPEEASVKESVAEEILLEPLAGPSAEMVESEFSAEEKTIPEEIPKTETVPEKEVVAESQAIAADLVSQTDTAPPTATEELKPSVEPVVEEEADVRRAGVEVESPEVVEEKPSEAIPSIKPPISMPDLPESVKIPDNAQERADLIIEIYEALFMAMAIGASKIMGVYPARGLTKQFLPSSECKELLEGVDVKSNAVIDFDALRVNAEKIKVEDKESVFLRDFSQIIKVITDNYGKVMGYDAFRGMVRSEFRAINDSFGEAMKELGIKEKMHPELQKLL
jgi:predicted regulator of Ras-like GTPase activity (Roadblock/LC7/MglB family)